jgi:hypothetical protein
MNVEIGFFAFITVFLALSGLSDPIQKQNNDVKEPTEAKAQYNSKPASFCTAGGSVIFKPDLKYEILIAMHVLVDPSHHRQAHEWACETLGKLSSDTKADIFSLVENTVTEWQLSNSIRNCDAQNSIERLLNYIREGNIVVEYTKVSPSVSKDFPGFFASVVRRFWDEAFQKDYNEKYYPILLEDAKNKCAQIENINLIEFMEKWTGRQFKVKKKLIFYPSYFIQPHAHGFDAEEGYVTIYQVQGDVVGNAIHELLHQLLSNWYKEPRVKEIVGKFGKSNKFKNEYEEKGDKSYTYPEGWLEEDIVMALSAFLYAKLNGEDLNIPRGGLYTDIQRDMYHAIATKYSPEKYKNFDDFLAEFLTEYYIANN